MTWRLLEGDCVEVMAGMPDASVDAVVCDPPYGLEFMGKDWDRLDGEGWRAGGGFTKPGIGDRPTAWASYGSGDTANATCARCGGRMRGARRCECDEPEWRVKGKQLQAAGADSRQAQGRKMQQWHEAWAVEALRVLKPGGHLLAFGGTRTYHRLACAVEDAGFEIRDCLAWLYGSGFPKSLDVSKALDKAAGAEREIVGQGPNAARRPASRRVGDGGTPGHALHYGDGDPLTAPATPDAETWQGWGTALKPAHEPIVMARKPLVGTVAGNVLAHGTGALNVDGCRIEHDERSAAWVAKWSGHDGHPDDSPTHGKGIGNRFGGSPSGRWPANVLLDPEAAPMLDEQSGNRPGMATQRDMQHTPSAYFGADKYPGVREGFNDSGGASRFFYCAKASSGERNAGLDGFEARGAVTGINPTRPVCNVCGCGTVVPGPGKTMRCGHTDIRFEDARPVQQRNSHPTVKPINLMRWLVRLVTPPGGTVLDPFTGSGTTGCAAVLEGFEFVGIERDPEYAPIARARIEWWEQHPDGMALVERLTAERARAAVTDSGQLDLLSFVDPSPGGTGQ